MSGIPRDEQLFDRANFSVKLPTYFIQGTCSVTNRRSPKHSIPGSTVQLTDVNCTSSYR